MDSDDRAVTLQQKPEPAQIDRARGDGQTPSAVSTRPRLDEPSPSKGSEDAADVYGIGRGPTGELDRADGTVTRLQSKKSEYMGGHGEFQAERT